MDFVCSLNVYNIFRLWLIDFSVESAYTLVSMV